jgi:hypothetical protein
MFSWFFLSISMINARPWQIAANMFFAVCGAYLIDYIFKEIRYHGEQEAWHWVVIVGYIIFSFFWSVNIAFSNGRREAIKKKQEIESKNNLPPEELSSVELESSFDVNNPACAAACFTPPEQPLPVGCSYPSCYNCERAKSYLLSQEQ